MGVNIHGGTGLGVAQTAGSGAYILMTCDQERGGCVPETVEGNHGQRLLVAGQGFLDSAVSHQKWT